MLLVTTHGSAWTWRGTKMRSEHLPPSASRRRTLAQTARGDAGWWTWAHLQSEKRGGTQVRACLRRCCTMREQSLVLFSHQESLPHATSLTWCLLPQSPTRLLLSSLQGHLHMHRPVGVHRQASAQLASGALAPGVQGPSGVDGQGVGLPTRSVHDVGRSQGGHSARGQHEDVGL